jgi:hypothetical protein
VDDYIIDANHSTMRLSTGYAMETGLKKIQLQANPPEADRICLNPQFQLQKSILTTKPAFVI